MSLAVEVSADIDALNKGMDGAAKAVESSIARMNRAAASVDRFGKNFDALDAGAKRVARTINDAAGAVELFASSNSSLGRSLVPVTNAVRGLADVGGTLASVFRGGAAGFGGLGFANLVPVLGAVVAAGTALYGIYRSIVPATQEAAAAESKYATALSLSEPYMRKLAEASGQLERERRAQAVAAIEAAKAEKEIAIASVQAAVAQQRRAVVTLEDLQNAEQYADGAQRVIAGLNGEIATLNERLAAVNAPATAAAGGMQRATVAAQSLEQVLARLRASASGQSYAAGLAQVGEAAQNATQIIQSGLTPLERYQEELARIGTAAETIYARQGEQRGRQTIEAATEAALRQLRESEQQTNRGAEAARQLGLIFESAFEQAVAGGRRFSDVVRGLTNDLARMILRQTVTEPVTTGVRSLLAPIGEGIGNWFSGLIGGARAMGGPVAAGVPYLVGEQGPELFVPGASGAIVPNGGFGGGGAVTIVNKNDFRGADPSSEARILAAIRAGDERTLAAAFDMMRRGGSARAVVRGA